MAKEAKALFAKCPNCATMTAQPVESYRMALKTGECRSFTCPNCKMDYSVRTEQVSCGVIQQATPQTHPFHVSA